MHVWSRLLTIQAKVENAFAWIAGTLVLAMMFLVTSDVLLRQLFNQPVAGTFELMEMGMVGVVYLGVAFVQRQRGHISIEMATDWLPPRGRRLLEAFGSLIGLAFAAFLTWRGAVYAWDAFYTGSYVGSVLKLPLWPARALIPVGSAVLSARLVVDTITDFAEAFRGSIDSASLHRNTEHEVGLH